MMSIPFKKNKIIKHKGGRACKPLKLITESLGSFSNQERVSDEITSMFHDMYLNNTDVKVSSFLIDDRNILFKLALKESMLNYIHANILPYGDESKIDYIVMELVVPIGNFDYNKAKEAISHELMHGNIFSKIVVNRGNFKISDIYEGLINIINNESSSLLYNFAYGLYATFYQEQQAIVSSVFSQLATMLYDKNFQDMSYDIKTKIYKKALVNTEAYQTYYYILKEVVPEIESLDEEGIKKLEYQFKTYNINIKIKKENKIMKRKCIAAIKDICRAGSGFFYKNLVN